MSISEEARRADALALLEQLFSSLGDAPIDCTRFEGSDAAFVGIQNTSWDELCSEGLLEKQSDSLYVLTPAGWSEALLRAGTLSAPGFQDRIGKLAGFLKDQIKGREKSEVVAFDEIVRSTGLPSGWVFNVIDSHLLSRMEGRRDAFWFESARGRLVEVPRDFGLIKVDLFADIRAENLRLQETVEEMEELYREYRCEICSAPLIGIHPWEHQYGYEEATEYACGRTIGGPHGDTPCPKDPKFPKFEAFVLTTQRQENGWMCYASSVSNVDLRYTWGKTEEEAKSAMHEVYLRRAKPWKG